MCATSYNLGPLNSDVLGWGWKPDGQTHQPAGSVPGSSVRFGDIDGYVTSCLPRTCQFLCVYFIHRGKLFKKITN